MPDGFIERFADVCARFPSAQAVVENGTSAWRFGELFSRVEQLGSALIERGAGPEQVIALAISKSTEYVVAMLACWYAGAAFVPLDPTLPHARKLDYLTRVEAQLVLSAGDVAEPFPAEVMVVRTSDRARRSRAPVAQDPERLAYVIFTSGSSGEPKGVAVSHRALVPMLDAQIALFALGPGERSLWLLSTAFDASISDIGTALLSGSTLHIQPKARVETPQALFATIDRLAISYVDLPPSLLPYLSPVQPRSLKTVVIGGEVGVASAIRHWASRVRLVNVYGPTEATVCTSATLCTSDWNRPLLGTELPGVRYEVVRADGAPCDDGEPGELYISGPCLARGYLNAAELTAARFVTRNGVRAFRTGDRVLRTRDGALEFLGRIDRQIKLRGALVAPEEIEARLLELPGVRRAAVSCDGPRATLVAYVEGERDDVVALKRQLATRLPRYMIPDRIVRLSALPTTESGKPDFSRLEGLTTPHQRRGALPTTPIERRLAGCFSQVLGVEVGLEDDFFALGGTSLNLVELLALACQQGIELTPALVAENATIAGLAKAAQSSNWQHGLATHRLQAKIDDEVRAARARFEQQGIADDSDAVLVTGATGFLGARLVHELLATTRSRILCLVRASSEQVARSRILSALQEQRPTDTSDARSRLVPILGDLERPNFGLGDREFATVAGRVHTVFHSGAQVGLMADCDALWPANVGGTREVMRLVANGRSKVLHYVSTLAVFVCADEGRGTFEEADRLDTTKVVFGGYAQTKWAAERLVRALAHHPGSTYIHRLGLLTGSSAPGGATPHDWLALTVRGLALLGEIPADLDRELALDVTPVDYAARAIVAIASRANGEPVIHTTHLAGPRPAHFSDLVLAMRTAGVDLKVSERSAWLAKLQRVLAARADHELSAACLALRRACLGAVANRELDLFQATRCRFDDHHARALLQGSGIECPSVTVELLTRYVQNILNLERAADGR